MYVNVSVHGMHVQVCGLELLLESSCYCAIDKLPLTMVLIQIKAKQYMVNTVKPW